MDDTNMQESSCAEYVYSDEYIGYFVKYDNDLNGVKEIFEPACIDVINSRFLVAYRKAPDLDNLEEFFDAGYGNLPKVYSLMDVSAVEDIGAIAVRDLPGLNLDGRGVLVGVIDTGIDFTSPAFLDRQGNSRIEYIWDQNKEAYGVAPPVFGYGGEYSKADINRAIKSETPYQIIPSRDEDGHGTFLASIVAGATDLENNFTGVAPESSIIMVKLKSAPGILKDFYYVGQESICYSETDIAQGIRYLINKAVQLEKPLVICIGLGTNQGDHNGNSNLELYIDLLSGLRGICFVIAGGNELGGRHHYEEGGDYLREEEKGTVEINVSEGVSGFCMEMWGNAPGLLNIIIESPSGGRFDNFIPNKSEGIVGNFLFEGSSVFVKNEVVEGVSGDQVIFFRFTKPREGIWRIYVTESLNRLGGGYNVWLPIDGFVGDRVTFIKSSPDITITSPGNCRGCITNATYNNKNNAIFVESSRGYTRKGNIKPDITSPGVNITGVFPGGSRQTLYTRKSGSSVGAAFVAGCAALLLQWGIVDRNNIGITTEVIKQQLIRGAVRDKELDYPNNIWGWGLLNILKTFENIRQ